MEVASVWIECMNRRGVLDRMLRSGMDGWSHLLPICACVVLILLSVLSLIDAASSNSMVDLRSFLHVSEILILVLLSPLLFTRIANILAIFLISYLATKIAFAPGNLTTGSPATLVLFCCLGVLMTLGDRLPWLGRRTGNLFGDRLRSMMLMVLSLASAAIILVTMFKAAGFSRWFAGQVGISLAPQLLLLALALQLILWLMVAMGIVSPMILSFLSLPTFAAALFLTGLTSSVLITPFIVCLALATTLPPQQGFAQS